MARHQQDREDLLAEAKALVERASLKIPALADEVIVGFRTNGSASFYFGPDPVFQFASSGALRRAYVDGLLYKAENGRLVSLERRRTPKAVEMLRHELSDQRQQALIELARQQLNALSEALQMGTCHLVGQVPETTDVVTRITDWLAQHSGPIAVGTSPGAR